MNKHTKVLLAKTQKYSFKMVTKLFGICLGSFLIALAYNTLVTPNHLLSGGFGGIALAINYLTGFPIYITVFLLNIPVMIWGYKELDREYMFFSLIGTLTFIFALPAIRPFLNTIIPIPKLDIILAAVFSGIIIGLGVGITIRFGSSPGGNSMIAVILRKKLNIHVGGFSFIFNLFVLLTSLLFFDLQTILYTFISMWVSGQVTDFVLEGYKIKKSVMIVSDKYKEIAEVILSEVHRGVTYIEAEGAYSGEPKVMINTIVNNFECAKIWEIVNSIDNKAFMYITEAIDVSGKGFTRPK